VISETTVDEDDGRPLPRFDREEPRPVAFELNFSRRTCVLRSGYRIAYLEWVIGVSGGRSWCSHERSVHPRRVKQQLTSFDSTRSDAAIRVTDMAVLAGDVASILLRHDHTRRERRWCSSCLNLRPASSRKAAPNGTPAGTASFFRTRELALSFRRDDWTTTT
jgi:hypothetical protein